MKWTEFTDIACCRAFDHFFYIKKPEYRNDIIEWSVRRGDELIAEGKTIKMSVAKSACKEIYTRLKREDKNIYVKSNNKLTRKRYGKVGSQVSGVS